MSLVTEAAPQRPAITVGGARYDSLMATLCGLFQAGAYLDLWAHVHRPELETFFTPWHAVLYFGFLAVAALTAARGMAARVADARPVARRTRAVLFAVRVHVLDPVCAPARPAVGGRPATVRRR